MSTSPTDDSEVVEPSAHRPSVGPHASLDDSGALPAVADHDPTASLRAAGDDASLSQAEAAAPRRAPEPLTSLTTATADPGADTLSLPADGELDLPTVAAEHYRIDGEMARGGLGRILRGHDRRLRRTVAIKQLSARGPAAALRFVREARVTAQLEHPAIVPIHEAGRFATGELFYTMKLISGRSLKEALDEAHTLPERLQLLRHVTAAAEAMAYAHQHHVIHRDLKPSNIMVGPYGETIIIDWGLAKATDTAALSADESLDGLIADASAELTQAGTVVGTPHYMSPEQARGDDLDERTDVYSLGVILYQLLTGKLPFSGSSAAEVIRSVASHTPKPIASLAPDAPEELAAIARKAMSLEPGARYATAAELAKDLRSFETGKLVSAHTYSVLLLLKRWLGRHRLTVALAAAFLAASLVGGVVSLDRVLTARRVAEEHSHQLTLVQARTALDRDATAALAWLKTFPREVLARPEVRDVALQAWSRGVARHVFRGTDEAAPLGMFIAGGHQFACAGPGSTIEVRDVATGAAARHWRFPGHPALATFSADGQTLAVIDNDTERTAVALFARDIAPPRRLPGPPGQRPIEQLKFAPDGQMLLGVNADRQLWVWDVKAGTRRALGQAQAIFESASFSPDSQHIVYVGADNELRILPLAIDQPRIVLRGHTKEVRSFRYSSDGSRLVTGGGDRSVRVWDTASGQGRIVGMHDGAVLSVAFSPRGTHVVSGSDDRTVRLWELASGSGSTLATLSELVCEVAFSPDGRLVAAGSFDNTVRLWDLDSGDSQILRGHEAEVCHLEFSPDGQMLASVSEDHSARIWALRERSSRVLAGHGDLVRKVVVSPDNHWLASTSRDRSVQLWNLHTNEHHPVGWAEHFVLELAFSPDSRSLALGDIDGNVGVWSVAQAQGTLLGQHLGPVRAVAFSPGGQLLAAGAADGRVRLWTVPGHVERILAQRPGELWALAFSPDGQLLASAGSDQVVHLWDVTQGTEVATLRGHTAVVRRLRFSPDGRTLASGSGDGQIWLWQVATRTGRPLGAHEGGVQALIYAPDSTRLATAGEDRVVHVWNLQTGGDVVLSGHSKRLAGLALSPDGRQLASASWDGTARIWDFTTLRCERILRHGAVLSDVTFSADGSFLAGASVDSLIRLWPLDASFRVPADGAQLQSWLEHATTVRISADHQATTP